jgi:hypothetical protein
VAGLIPGGVIGCFFLIDSWKMVWNGKVCGKWKVMRISRQFPVKLMADKKQLENVEFFKHLGSMLTDDGRCTV